MIQVFLLEGTIAWCVERTNKKLFVVDYHQLHLPVFVSDRSWEIAEAKFQCGTKEALYFIDDKKPSQDHIKEALEKRFAELLRGTVINFRFHQYSLELIAVLMKKTEVAV